MDFHHEDGFGWDEEQGWTGWIRIRPVVTHRFAELEAPRGYLGPSLEAGVAWYDRPVGTTRPEGGTP